MINCTRCGKPIKSEMVSTFWIKNVQTNRYHPECRRLAANERSRIRNKAKRDEARQARIAKWQEQAPKTIVEPSTGIKMNQYPMDSMPEFPFMTDEQWYQSDYYKQLRAKSLKNNGKI